jgi:pre-mRNA-splicing factor 18
MDAIKAEIASKRKVLQDDPVASSRPTKYMRRGDIERLKEEQELKAREERERKENEQNKATVSIYLIYTSPQVSLVDGG